MLKHAIIKSLDNLKMTKMELEILAFKDTLPDKGANPLPPPEPKKLEYMHIPPGALDKMPFLLS